MNIQLYFLRVRNVWKQIYRFFERRWKRNALWTTIIVIFFVTGLGLGKAWASPESGLAARLTTSKRIAGVQRLQRERSDWVSATTTTTTTQPKVTKSPVGLPSPKEVNYVAPVAATPEYPGSPQDWMREAGIPESDWPQAELLVSREGGWRPCVHNGGIIDCAYSGNKAYGIPQSLPGSKMAVMGADWRTNPVTQLRWMKAYVEDVYGTWANANAKWESRSPPWY